MDKIREEFDKWMGESTGYDGYEKGYVYVGFEACYRSKGKEIKKLKEDFEELKEAIKQEREENAMICDALEKQYTDMYEKRDDKHYESLAISAEICRDKIRARSKE